VATHKQDVNADHVASYLDLMDGQLTKLLGALAPNESHLWVRPSPNEWSPGEHLDHATSVQRFFTSLHIALWPLSSLLAHVRSSRPYNPDIDDVYARPGFPLSAGLLWPPRHHSARTSSLPRLSHDLRQEHKRARSFYSSKPDEILGRALLFFPSIGWINYVQSLRIAIYHDAHHFVAITKILTHPTGSK
jgi:hypothetical protein